MKAWQMMRRFGQVASGGGGVSGYAALLHFDGAHGSSVFTDESGKSWTKAGTAQIDTSASKFGGSCGLFAGGHIAAASHADFGFGTGDFTFSAWLKPSSTSGNQCIFDFRSGSYGYALYSAMSGYSGAVGFAGIYGVLGSAGTVLSTADFTHVEFSRGGGRIRIFIGGVKKLDYADTVDLGTSQPAMIGNNATLVQPYQGRVDEVAVVKGIALHTSDFTPPSAPFPYPA